MITPTEASTCIQDKESPSCQQCPEQKAQSRTPHPNNNTKQQHNNKTNTQMPTSANGITTSYLYQPKGGGEAYLLPTEHKSHPTKAYTNHWTNLPAKSRNQKEEIIQLQCLRKDLRHNTFFVYFHFHFLIHILENEKAEKCWANDGTNSII